MIDDGPKGEDVIDQGADYGGFADYDFETGDGFDYAHEQE
jgi:predicted rRNA methylase YqxC with S4 and FtsJ domains